VTHRPRHPLRVLESRRLTLVAGTRELLAADLAGPAAFGEAIGADVPEEWPPELYDSPAMRYSRKRMVPVVPAEQATPATSGPGHLRLQG